MKTRGTVGALLAAAALAAAWLLRPQAPEPPVDPPTASEAAARAADPPPALASPGPRAAERAEGPRGRLVGTVRRAGRPVAARIEVRWLMSLERFAQGHTVERTLDDDLRPVRAGGPDAEGSAGPDGRYEVDVPTGYLDVTAVAEDGARGRARPSLPTAGQRVTADVDLFPACSLSGRARYADGRPFRGLVVVRPTDTYGPVLEEEAVATDEDGGFRVAGLAEGQHGTSFVVPGVVLYHLLGPLLPTAEAWDVVVDGDAEDLAGRVVDADGDAPVEGATVVVTSSWTGRSLRSRARSDADGAFRATRLRDDPNPWICATADGYATRSVDGRPSPPVTVRLARAATLAGTVRRAADGSPVAGARVRVVVAEGDRTANPLGESATDAEGRYAFGGLGPGDVAVFASAPGLSSVLAPRASTSGWPDHAATLVAGRRTEKDLLLVPGGVLVGRVLDAGGAPVPGAVVGVAAVEREDPRWVDPAFHDRSCTAGEAGAFRLEGLPPGLSATLTAASPGYGSASAEPALATYPPTGEVVIRFEPVRRITVRVVRASDGAPVPEAAVREYDGGQRTATDAAGEAVVVAGTDRATRVHVRAAGFVPVSRQVGAAETSVEVRLAAGHAMTGRVLREDGTPAPQATVVAGLEPDGAEFVSTSVRADGAFTLEDLPDAEVVVVAHTWDFASHASGTGRGRPGTPITVRLGPRRPYDESKSASPPERVVRARVVDSSGRPVEGASGWFVRRGRREGLMVLAGEARFVAAPGEAGVVEIWNARDGYGRSLDLAPGRADVPAGATTVEVRLSPGAAVAGRVVDPDGRPVRGVAVEAARLRDVLDVAEQGSHDSFAALAGTRTDADGRFRLAGLPRDADLRLVLRPPPDFARPDPIPVQGGDASVVLALTRGVEPVVRVVESGGAPVPGATVVIEVVREGALLPQASVDTDGDGVARVPSLDPRATYRLSAMPRGRLDILPRIVEPWTAGDVTLVLPRTGALEGIVVGPDGRGVRAWVVRAPRLPGGTGSGASTGEDGRFRFRDVVEGPVSLRVAAEGFVPRDVPVVAAPDTPPLRVVLQRGAAWRFAVEGWPAGRTGGAYLHDESETSREVDAAGEIDGTGVFTVLGVDSARTYRVWVPPESGDAYVLARGLRPSEGVTRLALARGGSIRGTLRLPEGIEHLQCEARADRLFAEGVATPDGALEVRGLPPGRWTVTVRGRTDSCAWKGSAEASPGDEVRIALEPTSER